MSRLIKNVGSKITINVFFIIRIFFTFSTHKILRSHPLAHYQQSLLIQ